MLANMNPAMLEGMLTSLQAMDEGSLKEVRQAVKIHCSCSGRSACDVSAMSHNAVAKMCCCTMSITCCK
jgi:hypothetical protein